MPGPHDGLRLGREFNFDRYYIGDTVTYLAFGGVRRRVLVQHKEHDVKNGRPGFTGVEMDTDLPVWGYDSQITSVQPQES